MLRSVIIDDEKKAREAIRIALKMYCENVEIVGEAESVQSGIELINNTLPDLVFLDIKMQDGSGFDLLNRFTSLDFIPVFITAYNHYAIKAFKYSALDYLVKPVDPDELIKTVERAAEYAESQDIIRKIEALNINITNKLSEPKKIVLKTEQKMFVTDISDIVNCESDGNYTTVYLINDKKILVSKILKEFEELLKDNNFLRIHQSHLINLNYLTGFEKQTGYVIMKNNKKLPVSTRKKNVLINFLDKLSF